MRQDGLVRDIVNMISRAKFERKHVISSADSRRRDDDMFQQHVSGDDHVTSVSRSEI